MAEIHADKNKRVGGGISFDHWHSFAKEYLRDKMTKKEGDKLTIMLHIGKDAREARMPRESTDELGTEYQGPVLRGEKSPEARRKEVEALKIDRKRGLEFYDSVEDEELRMPKENSDDLGINYEGGVLSGETTPEAQRSAEARKAIKRGLTRYEDVSDYDPVLTSHCRL